MGAASNEAAPILVMAPAKKRLPRSCVNLGLEIGWTNMLG
jgi:hypothetical protein